MGEWLPPKTEPHRCKRPEIGWHTPGERWRCDCGTVYVVVAVAQHGESWKQWKLEKP